MDSDKNGITVNIEKVIEAECDNCKKKIDVSEFEPFTEIECPHCGTKMEVPGKIGNFTLLNIMGKGGMGSVYRARDEVLGRLVAIKVILPSLAQDKEFINTFKHEAQAAAKVNHPHIAQIYSFGEENGHPYIVMELVSGRGLDTMIEENNQLDQGMIMQIGMDIADGLREADEMGLIHGDIKPENILLDDKMNAKLIDFGIASVGGTQAADGIWGTPYYIAPEKLRREKVDARSDIYCLGATLYHALAGQPPFDGETPAEVVKARLEHEAPLLSEVRPDIDKEVEQIIARMLKMERSQRYPTYTSLLGDMKKVVDVLKPQISKINKSKKIVIKKKGGTIKVSPSSKPIITSSNKAVSSKTLRPVSSDGSSPEGELTAEEKANRKKILLKILWGFLAVIAIIGIITGGVFYKIKKNKELSIKRAQYELGNAIAQARNYNEKIHQKISNIKKLTVKTTEIEQQAVTIAAKLTGESAETIRQEVIPPPPEPKPVISTNNVTASNAVPAKAENSTNAPSAASAPASNITEQAKAPAPEPVKNDAPSIALTKKVFILTAKINEQLEQAQKIGKDADSVLAEAEKARSKKAAEGILPGLENMQAQLDSISKKIEKMLKKTSSPITELNALLENRKQELEEAKREQEQEALRKKQEAELQRKQAEHQAKVNQDLALIGNADAALKAAVRTQEYDDFIFDLKKKKDKLITKEGKETINKYIDQAVYLQDLKTFLIKQLNKYPYKWGWIEGGSPEDIIKATPKRIFLKGRSVTWNNVSPKQYYKIATHYINEQNKNVKLVDLAKNAMGLAIYLNTYGAYERAVGFADKAINWSPRFTKEKARLLPPPPEKDDTKTTTDDENTE